jgi:hypothetical protein
MHMSSETMTETPQSKAAAFLIGNRWAPGDEDDD